MLFVCEFCEAKICSSYKYWKRHLLGQKHQKNIEFDFLSWGQPEDEGTEVSFVITFSPPSNKRGERETLSAETVLNHFCNFGIISNFYVDPVGKFFILQYEEEFETSFKTTEWKSQKIDDTIVEISTKSQFSEEEWKALLCIQDQGDDDVDFSLSQLVIKVDLSNPNKRDVLHISPDHKGSKNSLNDDSDLDFSILFSDPSGSHHILQSPSERIKVSNSFVKLSLPKQLEIFENCITLSIKDVEIRNNLVLNLENILKKHFSSCKIHPFGSFVTGLGSVTSDVDLFMEVEMVEEAGGQEENSRSYYNSNNKANESDANNNLNNSSTTSSCSSEELVHLVKKILRKAKNPNSRSRFCSQVFGVFAARVPIVKFVHGDSGLNVDISFENFLSVQNSKLIKFYMTFDPRVKQLTLMIRFWAQKKSLVGSHKIKSYGLVLMILTFLMKKRIIPTVQELQKAAKFSGSGSLIEIEGWDASFAENFSWKNNSRKNTDSILELCTAFFKMYSQLEVENRVICPLLGIFMPRDDFQLGREKKLPRAFDRYRSWVEEDGYLLDISSPLCIQDPFDLAFNVCGICPENVVYQYQADCLIAYNKLERREREQPQRNSASLLDII